MTGKGGAAYPCRGMFLKRKTGPPAPFWECKRQHGDYVIQRDLTTGVGGRRRAAGGEVQHWLTGGAAQRGEDQARGGMKTNIGAMIRDTQEDPRYLC